MKKFIQLTNEKYVNTANIARIDRWYFKNSEYNRWEYDYENMMQDLINMYIEKHPELLITNDTDNEIITKLRKRFDKHIRKELGEIEHGHMEYTVVLHNGSLIHISEDVYNEICKEYGIDMTNKFDEFYNTEESFNDELFFTED